MRNRILHTSPVPTLLPRLVVGLVFLSEGLQKFILPEVVGTGRFTKIGFEHPEFWAYFTAYFEISCGIFILLGFLTRIMAIPPLIIMIVAFATTKYPILIEKGFWPMAHEYRTDFAMTILLVFLLIYGGGKYSFDNKIVKNYKNKKPPQ